MLGKRLIKSNDSGGACTNTVDLYNPFPDGGGVALYQLNGDATDVSGNYDGTASNVTYGTGQFGQAGVFNGSSSYIDTNAKIPASLDFSVSFWMKSNDTSTGNHYIFSTKGNYLTNGWFVTNNAGYIVYGEGNGVDNATSQTSPSIVANGNWNHVVVTRAAGGTINMYVNGTRVITNASVGTYFMTSSTWAYDTHIGRYAASSILFYDGELDQVRIFNRALRPYEVEALYTEEYCTPTIVPSEHFNTVTYDGNSVNNREISVGFKPDFTWIKKRSADNAAHNIFDSVRGAVNSLSSNTTGAEDTSPDFGFLASFESNGFTLGDGVGGGGYSGSWETNQTGQTYVAWNFKAGGAAVTNTDGTITSQVSANTEAGFSIVSWTGTTTTSDTIGHGLSEVPTIVLMKNRSSTSDWFYYTTQIDGSYDYLRFNSTNAKANSGRNAPTSNVFDQSTMAGAIGSGDECIAYCFAEVEGFSNFGSYVGNGSTSGPTVITGFEPAFIMVKCSSSTGDWVMLDNKRTIENPRNKALWANLSNAEATGYSTDFLENGFQIKDNGSALNASGASYIYMAFAADPTAVEPTLEDSFNTVLYTGNSSGQSVTGAGFQPDLTWLKNRSITQSHHLIDSVRGTTFSLNSNQTAAEVNRGSEFSSFDSDGFTLGSGTNMNNSGNNYVSWNWKGAEIPAINSNGSIPSVVSANPAAGFSIVSYTGNGSTGTIGHGLSSAPSMLIIKNRSSSTNWVVGSNEIGWNYSLNLNDTSSAGLSTNRFNSTSPTSTVFSVGATSVSNGSGNSMIAYCFAEVAGFSKFGSYVGNGNGSYDPTGTIVAQTIITGFEPAFVMVKRTDATEEWVIVDNKRGGSSPGSEWLKLYPRKSDAEANSAYAGGYSSFVDFTSNGFTLGNDPSLQFNVSGGTYIYMAFANQF